MSEGNQANAEDILLLESVFENTPLGMVILDKDGRILRINRQQEKQSRIKREDVIGMLFHELWSKLFDQEPVGDHFWDLLKNRTPYTVVGHNVEPRFHDLEVSYIAHGVPLASGKLLLIYDVSSASRSDRGNLDRLNIELSQTATFLRGVLDSSPNAILTIDKNGGILSINKTTETLFGAPKGEMLWQSISHLFAEAIEIPDLLQLSRRKAGLTIQCRTNDERTFLVKIRVSQIPSELDEAPRFLVILEDQTYETKLEKELSERLRLEMVLSEIFAALINAGPEEIDSKVNFALSRICQRLEIDRCILAMFDTDLGQYTITHAGAREGVESHPVGTRHKNFPWMTRMLMAKKIVKLNNPGDDLPDEAVEERRYHEIYQTKSALFIPLIHKQKTVGALNLEQVSSERTWDHDLELRVRIIGEVLLNVLMKKQSDENLQQALQEITQLKDRLEVERNYLLDEIKLAHNFEEIIGQSPELKKTLKDVEEVAPTEATVLIMGETGTGKELLARAIHNKSKRCDRPLVKVNCASLPTNLIESELFGHEKGAFTGAHTRRKGRFETADGATLFLDEIGELPLETQAKLLRVLQENEFERLGSSQTVRVNIRIIVATNRNLEKEIEEGRFRQDLWFRLNVFPITAPVLRDRKDDIPLLVNWMVKKFSKQTGKLITNISAEAISALDSYHWPGNIRELQNVIERAVIKSHHQTLELTDMSEFQPTAAVKSEPALPSMAENERAYLLKILEKSNWNISGKGGASSIAGIPPSTLRFRMKKLNIDRPGP